MKQENPAGKSCNAADAKSFQGLDTHRTAPL